MMLSSRSRRTEQATTKSEKVKTPIFQGCFTMASRYNSDHI